MFSSDGINWTERPMKFCKDCRHFQPIHAQCGHESAAHYDLVTGEQRRFSASTVRGSGVSTDCGKEGRFWEPILKEVA